jgi:hypothetical protein
MEASRRVLLNDEGAAGGGSWGWNLATEGLRSVFSASFAAVFGKRHRFGKVERCAISKTGTGFAVAKLSEILPAARVARFVRMTHGFALLASSA